MKLKPAMLVLGGLLSTYGQSWSHNPASANGPTNWGSVASSYPTCGATNAGKFVEVGVKQTPIDIVSSDAVHAILPELVMRYKETPLDVKNTGHVVEVEYEPGSILRVGKSVVDEYRLLQFHFHAPSEHTIDGKSYDAELHLVHQNVLGELAVVGVLLSGNANAPLSHYDDIGTYAPVISGQTAHLAGVSVNVRELLPKDHTYFTYTGSLTTPPCTEGVHWYVLTTPVQVQPHVIRDLHNIISRFDGYNNYQNNNRPVAPLNGRKVLVATH